MKKSIFLVLFFLYATSLYSQSTTQDSIKIVHLEKKINNIQKNINGAGSNLQTAWIVTASGALASMLLYIATYDSKTKEYNPISFAPVIVCSIIGLIDYITGTQKLKTAGKE